MNLAPILVSVYNRKQHFINCIEALKNNRLASESILYVVSDAASTIEDENEIQDIRKYIVSIEGFKEVRPIFREKNYGAPESIFQAFDLIINKFGRIIALEDDVITSINFLEYMNGALNAYANDDRIITITGWAPPFKIPWFYKKNVWVNRRHCAWGFATWNNKWREINFNEFDRYSELIKNKKNLKKYAEDGEDLVYILKSDSFGEFDAPDIRICYHQYLYGKLTLYPVISKTHNIGFDGSGLRCGISNKYNVKLDDGKSKMKFPKKIDECFLLKLIAKSFYDDKSIFEIAFPILNRIWKMKLHIRHINRILRHFNIQVQRILPPDTEKEFFLHLSDELKSRQFFLNYYGINLLLDVGANIGQYSTLMRRIGYKGEIISFEPLKSAYSELKKKTELDDKWQCENFALGNKEEQAIIHISGNSYSSSLLEILPLHIEYDKDSQYVANETIQIKKLDDVFQNYYQPGEVVMLKIDTQGYEKNVLEGAKQSLINITLLQLEISIEPLYDKEVLFLEMINYLNEIGFELFTLENGIRNPKSGKLLQVDGIFVNKNKSNK
ncbi:MAG: FkbM family methyltransferase [Bacteroidales bacterium]|jgi:FkbM family methyltransferase